VDLISTEHAQSNGLFEVLKLKRLDIKAMSLYSSEQFICRRAWHTFFLDQSFQSLCSTSLCNDLAKGNLDLVICDVCRRQYSLELRSIQSSVDILFKIVDFFNKNGMDISPALARDIYCQRRIQDSGVYAIVQTLHSVLSWEKKISIDQCERLIDRLILTGLLTEDVAHVDKRILLKLHRTSSCNIPKYVPILYTIKKQL
jgi:transcription elongation factor Elf1